jgi:hypothetical protein
VAKDFKGLLEAVTAVQFGGIRGNEERFREEMVRTRGEPLTVIDYDDQRFERGRLQGEWTFQKYDRDFEGMVPCVNESEFDCGRSGLKSSTLVDISSL